MKNKCDCYRVEKRTKYLYYPVSGRRLEYYEDVGVCNGTKEREDCYCGGWKAKCDFYPKVREESTSDAEHEMGMVFADDRIQKAMEVAWAYSQTDGAWHKAWVIDQMVRALCGTEEIYNQWINEYTKPLDDGDHYNWDEGIAP